MTDVAPSAGDPLNLDKQQTPVNAPEQPYGQAVELDTLRQQFPQPPVPGGGMQPAEQDLDSDLPMMPPEDPELDASGVPMAVLDSGPRSPAAAGVAAATGAVNQAQNEIAILDALANDPNVRPETREWAQMRLDLILR